MEPPPGLSVETVRDERVKVLKGIRPLEPKDVVRGQFDGYRKEAGVKVDSQVETYVALRIHQFLAMEGRAVLHSRRQVYAHNRYGGNRHAPEAA